ncbi:hypothetical protein BsWGS_15133 [Bradybaena similaris]
MNNLVITYSRKRRVRKKKLEQVPVGVEQSKRGCDFCLSDEDNEIKYGIIYIKDDVMVHYFCMLLASGLCQNAKVSDKNSILGFTLSDIKKELHRGYRLKCCFCHQRGATIGCCVKSCRKAFHLSCGHEHGTMHQFFDSFRSYCENHRLEQVLPRKKPAKTCAICLCTVASYASCDTLIPPCCQKSVFHRQCMQQYSLSAGKHYFKCPLCNSVDEFQMEMRTYGIYIPDQDAAWEREPNAFVELLERHNRCDVSSCLCPQGRQFDADSGKYDLLLCGWCGAYGSHKACKGLVCRGVHLVCCDCAEIIDKAEIKQKEESQQQKQRRQSPGSRKRAFLQGELDEQSPTCSTAKRLKDSPRDQPWQQKKNSVSARKRTRLNSFQSPASLQGQNDSSVQKLNTFFPNSPWRWTAESSSPSRQQSSRNNVQGERQRSTGQQRGRPKHNAVATVFISNYIKWDSHLFACRVVLTKADQQINAILEKNLSFNNHSEMNQMKDSFTSLKPWSAKKSSCKSSLKQFFDSCAGRSTGNTRQTLMSQQIENLSAANNTSTVVANSSSEESLPDLTDMHDCWETSAGIFSERSPPVIKPGICWEVSPQKPKLKRSYSITVSEIKADSVGEILLGEAVYTDLTCDDQMSITDDSEPVLQSVEMHVCDSPASAITSPGAHECETNELTKTAQSDSSYTTTMIAITFQAQHLCQASAENKADTPETVQQDSNSFPQSSAVLNSPSLLPLNENHDLAHNNQDIDMTTNSAEKTLTCFDKMFMQTDIFGKVVMVDSSHKRRRMSKSKDSTAFLRLSQSKIENFLVTK